MTQEQNQLSSRKSETRAAMKVAIIRRYSGQSICSQVQSTSPSALSSTFSISSVPATLAKYQAYKTVNHKVTCNVALVALEQSQADP